MFLPLFFRHRTVGIEDLREKREEVNRQILQEEEEKAKIQKVRKWRILRPA